MLGSLVWERRVSIPYENAHDQRPDVQSCHCFVECCSLANRLLWLWILRRAGQVRNVKPRLQAAKFGIVSGVLVPRSQARRRRNMGGILPISQPCGHLVDRGALLRGILV